jgi:HK97 family phage portal protein
VRTGEYNLISGYYNFIEYLTEDGYKTEINVSRDDVMHFPNTYRYDNGMWGMPTLEFARGDLSLIKTQKELAKENAAKGGRVKLIIGEDTTKQIAPVSNGLFDKKEMEKYADEINDRIYQKDVVALRALDKVQPISMSAQDMQLVSQMELSYDDVARYFGVPRPLLMLDTNSHYNDYQNATMEFHTRTILPEKAAREKEIFRKLIGFTDYGYRDIHICEKPLLAMDPERQAKVDKQLIENGTKTPNEVRQEHDMPAVENGNEPMASANLMTLKALIAKSEASTTLKPGQYTVEPQSNQDDDKTK